MDDRELLQILQKNPENGMRLVMKEYTGLCYYIVKQKLADFSAEEIEECVSDVFLAFYHQYTAIDLERGSIKGFLAVLSRRKAVDRWRKLAGKRNTSFAGRNYGGEYAGTAGRPPDITGCSSGVG